MLSPAGFIIFRQSFNILFPLRGTRLNTAINFTELILPERQAKSAKRRLTGYLCRSALAFMCVCGFAVFINDALAFKIKPLMLLLTCALFCAWFSVMGISKRFFFGGSLLCAGFITFAALRSEHLLEKVYFCIVSLTNAFFRRLDAIGYKGAAKNILSFEYTLKKFNLTENDCRNFAFIAIMLFLSAVICAGILKRIHIFTLIAVGGPICTLFLYYGMSASNTGFAIITASLCGCVSLMGYDRIYTRKKVISETASQLPATKASRSELIFTLRRNSALGGFTGLASAVIALALLLGPANINKSMGDIPAISVPALKLENFIISMANGQNPDFSSLVFSGVASLDRRTTAAENRSYTGARMFEVQIDTPLPVYLRGWVGIDYYNDSWHSAGYDRIAEYKRLFGDGFTPETLTSELLYAIKPSLVGLPGGSGYKDHSELGYVTAAVNIRKLQPTANLIFMPSYTDQKLGLLEYGTRDKSNIGYSNYFDGIYTSTSYLFLDEYAVIANLQLLRDPDFASNLTYMINEYIHQSRSVSVIHKLLMEGAAQSAIDTAYKKNSVVSVASGGTSPNFIPTGEDTLAYRYTYEMNEDERQRVDALIDNALKYNDYVYQNYLTGCEEFESFQKLAREIVYNGMPVYSEMPSYAETPVYGEMSVYSGRTVYGGIGSYSARHIIAMAIIDYLSENMTYTLSPEEPTEAREYSNAAETFLFDTREGYCVQFATSAVMLLRSLGIPARYAEGYITDKYNRISSDNSAGRYSSTITDRNAHAWIEVYYDYYGWVQYEATAPYYSDMYESIIPTSGGSVNSPGYEFEIPDEIPEEIPGIIPPEIKANHITGNDILTVIIIVTLISATAAAVIIHIRAGRAKIRRDKLINSAKNKTLTPEKRLEAASSLDTGIFRLLAYNKLIPQSGEQQREFAARVDEKLGPISTHNFTRVSEAMLAGEFGTDIPHGRLAEIANYYENLIRCTLRGTNPLNRLWLKYIYI